MSYLQIMILAIIQGMAELLPVSSSAHVILAEKMMGLDPASPEMTFFLVMLHTGTMFAVLFFFRSRWKDIWQKQMSRNNFLKAIVTATAVTGVVGLGLKVLIEKVVFKHLMGQADGEVEALFRVLPLISTSLFVAGLLIIWSGLRQKKSTAVAEISNRQAAVLGLVQGLCLPFRGLSRSGVTISTALLQGIQKNFAEDLSFALAVVLTPPVVVLQLHRLVKNHVDMSTLTPFLVQGAIGMVLSFFAGLLALKWLSSWLEAGKWHVFGYYCLALSAFILWYQSVS
jgi:undecaprenyl-diphosphatase